MTDETYRFAGRSGKTTLYKFRPFRTWTQRRRVRQIVLGHRIYFARASELNDPFDMSPRLEPVEREGLLKAAAEYWARRTDASPEHRERQMQYLATCDLIEHRARAQKDMRRRIEDGHFSFSLAGNRDHPMLWSHYADGHTGLCIHFRAHDDSLFGASMGVVYSEMRKLVPVDVNAISHRELFQRATLHKGRFWEYEDEYRWPKFPDTNYDDLPIKFDGQVASFPAAALSGITVGARMSARNVARVVKMAARHASKLEVGRAIETDTYTFDFERIA